MCSTPYGLSACFVFMLILAAICSSGSGYPMESRAKSYRQSSTSLIANYSNRPVNSAPAANNRNNHHNNNNYRRNNRNNNNNTPTQHPRRHRVRHGNNCNDFDVSWKAFKAPNVVVGRIESQGCEEDLCTFNFKIVKNIKTLQQPAVGERVQLEYKNKSCGGKPHNFLVKDNKSGYLLFLEMERGRFHRHMFLPVPLDKKNKTISIANRAAKNKTTPVSLNLTSSYNRTQLTLVCKMNKGFPIPKIVWKLNGSPVRNKGRITVARRKVSTLVLRDYSRNDNISCSVTDVKGQHFEKKFKAASSLPTSSTDKAECPETPENYKKNYCFNNGICFHLPSMKEYGCECPQGFLGKRCEEKSSDQSSRYRQPSLYTCTEGLYTKNDGC